MYYSIRGSIAHKEKGFVALEVNNVCFQIFICRINNIEIGDEITVFTHLVIKDDSQFLYGFLTPFDKEAFLKLIGVSGVGPRTAINLISQNSLDSLINAIDTEDYAYFKLIPGIGTKLAAQIILALKGKFDVRSAEANYLKGPFSVLKALGFKEKEIQESYSRSKLNINESLNENEICLLLLSNIK